MINKNVISMLLVQEQLTGYHCLSMPAANITCPKTKGYVKIGIRSQYWLAKIFLILLAKISV